MSKKQSNWKIFFKFLFSLLLDGIDNFVGRIPILGKVYSIFVLIMCSLTWGASGLSYTWEILDLTGQVNTFIPTMTLVGIYNTFFLDTDIEFKQLIKKVKM